MAGPLARGGVDRDIADRIAGAGEGHGDGCGIGEAVWEQIEEALEVVRTHGAKARGQVLDGLPGDQGRKTVVETCSSLFISLNPCPNFEIHYTLKIREGCLCLLS